MTDRVRSREALVDTLAQTDPRETIRPREVASPDRTRPDGTVQLIGGDVDHVQVDERGLAALAPRLVLGTTIGEGGMAIVRIATQTALGREVAVKTARPENAAKAAPGLLREAWITGALEHPNIVPIHDLGADDAGRPILVLKRIEGRPWSAMLDKPLDWQLRQLEQVCHGVAFAHSRGIVHRDLKPANVMIGSFGEVYVLDWGIAVSLVDDGTGRLPLASSSREVAGTLAYMAPEMLEGVATERTDVYLLGAILFELLTGEPPHATASIDATVASIALSQPPITDDAPAELVAICRRAMATVPADRFASVEALRSAIVEFREHRDSSEIARAALERLAELEAKLAAPSPERAVTYQLYGEIRFGFHAALRAWPDNTAARAASDRAVVAMATFELDAGEAAAAAGLLADLAVPVPALAARLAVLEDETRAKASRVAALEADHDAAFGTHARTLLGALFGLVMAMAPLAAGLFPAIEVDHGLSLVVTGVSTVAFLAIVWRYRAALTGTALNRGVVATLFLSLVLHGAVEALAWGLGLDMVTTHMVSVALWSGACGAAAVFLDRGLLVPAIGFLAAFVACVQSPAHRLWAISASLGVLGLTAIYIWNEARRGRRRIGGLADVLRSTR